MNEAYHQKNQKKRQKKKQTDVKYLSICFLAKRKGKRFRYHLLRVLPCLYFLFFLFSSPPSILLIFLFPISFFFSYHVAINTKDLLILASLSPLLAFQVSLLDHPFLRLVSVALLIKSILVYFIV